MNTSRIATAAAAVWVLWYLGVLLPVIVLTFVVAGILSADIRRAHW